MGDPRCCGALGERSKARRCANFLVSLNAGPHPYLADLLDLCGTGARLKHLFPACRTKTPVPNV